MTAIQDPLRETILKSGRCPTAIDYHLVRAIKIHWVDDGEMLDELFRDGGPIGSFTAASASALRWTSPARKPIETC